MGYKVGSQHPAIGYQFDLISSFCFKNRYSFGIGGGIASNMGMGGKTFPVFTDARISLHLKDPILFQNKDKINDFYIATKLGIDINKNMPFKTGFLASFDLAYKVDFIRIKNTNLPAFFTDIAIEYSSSKFKDEYRGFVIHDGVLRHMMFTMKIVFEIPVLKI